MEYILGFLSNWLYLQWMREFLKCHLNAILPFQGSLIKDFLYIHEEKWEGRNKVTVLNVIWSENKYLQLFKFNFLTYVILTTILLYL